MKRKKSLQISKTFYVFFCLVLFSIVSLAQTPSANINGPLKAKVNGGNIQVTSQIAFGYENPLLTYTFKNNTSGAFIVSKGNYVYNAITGEGTQTITINPGNSAGSFVINLEIKTPFGTGTCSKSVVVSNISPGNLH